MDIMHKGWVSGNNGGLQNCVCVIVVVVCLFVCLCVCARKQSMCRSETVGG